MKVFRCLSALLLTVMTFASCVTEDDPSQAWSLPLGSEMPAFEVTLSDGIRVSDRDFEGKVAVIVLFNTSCPDCRAELPVVQEVSTLTGNDVRFLCIAREEGAESIARFWAEKELTLPYS
ncbi:MAG: TlpA family protein disulfide reductase, partial [Duncaniella sp.]|nr:TlpA family protein disulfide reductase [Duncaniella sp.]